MAARAVEDGLDGERERVSGAWAVTVAAASCRKKGASRANLVLSFAAAFRATQGAWPPPALLEASPRAGPARTTNWGRHAACCLCPSLRRFAADPACPS